MNYRAALEEYRRKLEGARESAYLRQLNFCSSPFRKILRGHVRTVSGNMLVKFEVCIALTVFELLAFNSHWPAAAHTQTHAHNRNTHIERTHYLRHSLRSLGGGNNARGVIRLVTI